MLCGGLYSDATGYIFAVLVAIPEHFPVLPHQISAITWHWFLNVFNPVLTSVDSAEAAWEHWNTADAPIRDFALASVRGERFRCY